MLFKAAASPKVGFSCCTLLWHGNAATLMRAPVTAGLNACKNSLLRMSAHDGRALQSGCSMRSNKTRRDSGVLSGISTMPSRSACQRSPSLGAGACWMSSKKVTPAEKMSQ